ncbi:ribonuclease H-like domain-containing protein [Tanacetum coccineum]|uniref:Ribonuclease H-like domain-containing protein n=1 Tax=Tanacetum coccineum TaxID=301880 RepID=A0ABQ4YKP9_9ASTR
MITRLQSGIVKPIDRLSLHTFSISPIPKNLSHALKDPNWRNAMYDEYNALVKNGTCPNTVDTKSKLGPEGAPVQDPTLYRSLAGGLKYLTRPDLSYAVQQICLNMHDPREPRLAALKRILRYVHGTLDLGLHLYASSTTSPVSYTDADWAVCPSTRRSTLVPKLNTGVNVVAETSWLRNLLRELHSPLSTATLVYCDNVSVVICLPTLFNINRRNTLRSTFISSEIWLPLVRFEFYMCPLVFNMPIFSPRGRLSHCLKNFDPV